MLYGGGGVVYKCMCKARNTKSYKKKTKQTTKLLPAELIMLMC